MTDDLIAWLRAQLDTDERVARRVEPNQSPNEVRAMVTRDGSQPFLVINSARVLAEVDAKRKLLECLVGATGKGTSRLVANDEPWAIGGDHLVKLLALPYADRPGYRDEWRP